MDQSESKTILSRSAHRYKQAVAALFGIVASLVLGLAQTRNAVACSPAPPGLTWRGAIPHHNATNVAPNSAIVVTYGGNDAPSGSPTDAGQVGPLGSDLVLRDATNETEVPADIVPLSWLDGGLASTTRAFRLQPRTPLRANTRYEERQRRGCDRGEVAHA